MLSLCPCSIFVLMGQMTIVLISNKHVQSNCHKKPYLIQKGYTHKQLLVIGEVTGGNVHAYSLVAQQQSRIVHQEYPVQTMQKGDLLPELIILHLCVCFVSYCHNMRTYFSCTEQTANLLTLQFTELQGFTLVKL